MLLCKHPVKDLGTVCVCVSVWGEEEAIHDSCDMLCALDMHGVSGLAWSILSGGGEQGAAPQRHALQHLSWCSLCVKNDSAGEASFQTKIYIYLKQKKVERTQEERRF